MSIITSLESREINAKQVERKNSRFEKWGLILYRFVQYDLRFPGKTRV